MLGKLRAGTRCTLVLSMLAALGNAGCGAEFSEACEGEECEMLDEKGEALFPLTTTIWRKATIPVCWENPVAAPAKANNDTERGWVKEAVTSTWDGVTRVGFSGWGTCSASSKGIRIRISDEGAHTARLGRQLDGLANGMVLNFTFQNWNQDCPSLYSLESCVKSVAVHEFGHALGFSHEQNRSDTPDPVCAGEEQGPDGNVLSGPWDADSIMNYCNPQYNNDGRISAGDIRFAKVFYGDPAKTTTRRAAFDRGNGKVYFFDKAEYSRYDLAADRIDSGYPKKIGGAWTGWPSAWASGVDAAFNRGNGEIYFFRDAQVAVFSLSEDRVVAAPAALAKKFSGWPASWTGVDAVVTSPASVAGQYWHKKAYFFRGSEYIRVNTETLTVEKGPTPISSGWSGLWSSGINYAFVRGSKAYFFRGTEYSRYNLSNTSALDKVDAGYPLPIMGYWPGAPF